MINRLWCLIVGHKKLRVIEEAEITEANIHGVAYRVERFRWECWRCKKPLPNPNSR